MTDEPIPDDIMQAAREIYEAFAHPDYLSDAGVSAIARAIMAERERSARIGYVTCVKTRHVTLGREVEAAIREQRNLADVAEAELSRLRAENERLRGALIGIEEYWDGGSESAVDAADEMRERARAALKGGE